MITINRNQLIIYIDTYLNYKAMQRVLNLNESFIDVLEKVIKLNWKDVPEEYENNSIACAEHIVDTTYKENL